MKQIKDCLLIEIFHAHDKQTEEKHIVENEINLNDSIYYDDRKMKPKKSKTNHFFLSFNKFLLLQRTTENEMTWNEMQRGE